MTPNSSDTLYEQLRYRALLKGKKGKERKSEYNRLYYADNKHILKENRRYAWHHMSAEEKERTSIRHRIYLLKRKNMVNYFNPTEDELARIKELRANHVNLRDIAVMFNTSASTIFNVVNFGRPFHDRALQIIIETLEMAKKREQGVLWKHICDEYKVNRASLFRRIRMYQNRTGVFSNEHLVRLASEMISHEDTQTAPSVSD